MVLASPICVSVGARLPLRADGLPVPTEPDPHADFDRLTRLAVFFFLVGTEDDDQAGRFVDKEVRPEVDLAEDAAFVAQLMIILDRLHIDGQRVSRVGFAGEFPELPGEVGILGVVQTRGRFPPRFAEVRNPEQVVLTRAATSS